MPLIFAGIKNHTLKCHGLSQCLEYFIPYPIILLCFVGTWRGLSHSTSFTSHKRKFVLGSLSLVVLNYTFLILPNAIKGFIKFFGFSVSPRFSNLFYCLWYLNPFVDCCTCSWEGKMMIYWYFYTAVEALTDIRIQHNTQPVPVLIIIMYSN